MRALPYEIGQKRIDACACAQQRKKGQQIHNIENNKSNDLSLSSSPGESRWKTTTKFKSFDLSCFPLCICICCYNVVRRPRIILYMSGVCVCVQKSTGFCAQAKYIITSSDVDFSILFHLATCGINKVLIMQHCGVTLHDTSSIGIFFIFLFLLEEVLMHFKHDWCSILWHNIQAGRCWNILGHHSYLTLV